MGSPSVSIAGLADAPTGLNLTFAELISSLLYQPNVEARMKELSAKKN